jgi:predicted RNA-binding protein with RPS1 domain
MTASHALFTQRLPDALRALPPALLEEAARLGASPVQQLLLHQTAAGVPTPLLRSLIVEGRRWHRLQMMREEADLSMLPAALHKRIQQPSHLALLQRGQRFFATAGETPSVEAWQALIDLWNGCVHLAWREGSLIVSAISMEHPRLSHFAELIADQGVCKEIPAHRWLAIRRGMQEGVLKLRYRLPDAALTEQMGVYRKALKPPEGRTEASLLQELVLDGLPQAIEEKLQEMAQEQSTLHAQREYHRLLTMEPIKLAPLASLSLARPQQPMGLLIVDPLGTAIHEETFPCEAKNIRTIGQLLHAHAVQAIALPLRAPAHDILQLAAKELGAIAPIYRVKEAAIATARLQWQAPPHKLTRELASARTQIHRLQDPFGAWSALDPLELGLAEYPEQIDLERLRQSLFDEIMLAGHALAHHKAEEISDTPRSSSLASFSTSATLNPLVKTLDDLRPGMTIQGIVSHCTDFGAFVQIGLPQEGMIHISELADQFVKHPSEIVRSGQHLRVRVLAVDTQQGRISLSLRPPRPEKGQSQGRAASSGSPPPSASPRSHSGGVKKADALKKLDQLFKKSPLA